VRNAVPAFLVILAAQAVAFSQISNERVIDHSVALGAMPLVRGSVYAGRSNGATPVIYIGEEVQIDVRVANATDVEIALGESDRS
jgi:hypothetical protein